MPKQEKILKTHKFWEEWDKYGSIIQLTNNEEVFLSHSKDLPHGPGIVRDGLGPPWMELIDKPGKITTNDKEQRYLSWFIDEDSKDAVVKDCADKPHEYETNNYGPYDWLRHFRQLPSHADIFKQDYPDYKIVGIQGAGDLTMNEYNVAFLNSKQTSNNDTLIYLPQEPLTHRKYTCLVKWKYLNNGNKMTIEENITFTSFPVPKVMQNNEDITNNIEFAIFGQQVIKNGQLVDFINIIEQFCDIRHAVNLPNLNPRENPEDPKTYLVELKPHTTPGIEPKIADMFYLFPRFFFGGIRTYDVWLGEAQLLADLNLRRSAIKIPILLNILHEGLGAPRPLVEAVMKRFGYIKKDDTDNIKEKLEWRFLPSDPTKSGDWIEIFLKAGGYPCSMVGIKNGPNGEPNSVFFAAYRCGYGLKDIEKNKPIHTVADEFRQITGVDNVLLFDEGGDVFQKVYDKNENSLKLLVPSEQNKARAQLRCCFIIGENNSNKFD